MGIGFLDSQKGEKSKFWKLESNGPACSHHRVVGGVCALRRVGFTSQLWSWTRAGPGQTFVPTCRARRFWRGSKQGEGGHFGGFLTAPDVPLALQQPRWSVSG